MKKIATLYWTTTTEVILKLQKWYVIWIIIIIIYACAEGQCRCYLQYKKAGANEYSITVHKHEDISVEKPNYHVLKRHVENHSAAFLSMVGVQFCNVMVLHAEDQMHHV